MKFVVWIFNITFFVLLAVIALMLILLTLIMHFIFRDTEAARFALLTAESVDQTMNACLHGNMDHTMSGRMGYRILTGKATKFELWLCRVLSEIDPTTDRHCIDAIEYDEVEKL